MKQAIERFRGILFFGLIILILAGIVLFQVLKPADPLPILSVLSPAPSPLPTATPHPLQVYVTGAVLNPDVYTLPADSRVKDAILAAGGAGEQADLNRINLAQPVADGQQIYVPSIGEETTAIPSGALPTGSRLSLPGESAKVNINLAGAAELELLPGIGPTMAQRIVDYRQAHGPFDTIEAIVDVDGIGEATLEEIRDLITTQ